MKLKSAFRIFPAADQNAVMAFLMTLTFDVQIADQTF
jgi:hypothetical protein